MPKIPKPTYQVMPLRRKISIAIDSASYKGKDLLESIGFNKKASWEISQRLSAVENKLTPELDGLESKQLTPSYARDYITNLVFQAIDEVTDFLFNSDIGNEPTTRPQGRPAYFRYQLKKAFLDVFDNN